MTEYKWFRLYHEFAKDSKVQSMPENMQRRLIMLFCLECSGELRSLTDDELAHSLSVNIETLHETFHVFQSKNFVNEKREICNWMKRQYLSDTSTNRVKKFREKQKLVKMKRFRNVTVTPPDTDTDTDTEIKERNKTKKIGLDDLSVEHIRDWLAEKRGKGKYQRHDEHFILERFKDYCNSKGKRYNDYIAAYRNAFEWDSCQPKQQKGVDPASNAHAKAQSIIARRTADWQNAGGQESAYDAT